MVKPIPAGKKGAGIRALKKKAPEVAARMGYEFGGTVVKADNAIDEVGNPKGKKVMAQLTGYGKARR